MRNSTIANNSAGGNGGGIGASGGSSTSELGGDTVARNLAGPGHVGGGLYQGNGDVIGVQDTIVALNLGGTAPIARAPPAAAVRRTGRRRQLFTTRS